MRLLKATAAAVAFVLEFAVPALALPMRAGLDLCVAGGPFGPGLGGTMAIGPVELGMEGHLWNTVSGRASLRCYPFEGTWRPFIGLSGYSGRLFIGSPESRPAFLGGIGELGLEWAFSDTWHLAALIGWSEAVSPEQTDVWGRNTFVSGPLVEVRLRWRPLNTAIAP